MIFRFTLNHSVLGSKVISEPDGWYGAKIKLERHQDFFSLIEYYEGAANGAFIFYGADTTEGIDGGIEFIRDVETTYGFDAAITILIEYAPDGLTFSTLFSGQLDISQKVEMKDNKMQIPVIRDDFWTKFINRLDTPVNLSDLVDLDGNVVPAVPPITVQLTPQALRERYDANSSSPGFTEEQVNVIVSGTYYQMSFDVVELEEIKDVFVLPQVDQTELPSPVIEPKYAGTYSFEIQTVAYDYDPAYSGIGNISDYIRFYININGTETEFAIGSTFDSTNIEGGRIYTLSLTNQVLPENSLIRIYGRAIANLTATPNYTGQIRWNGAVTGNNINIDSVMQPGITTIECFCTITADTIYPATEAQGYLIHDAIHGVLARIGLGTDPLYSEFLGGLLTTTKAYDDDGCGWMYALLKGVHIRGYTLTDDEDDPAVRYSLNQKAFFTSMKQLWDGINPILNLGLGYEVVDSVQVIRIEQKGHWIGATPPVNFSDVREISSSYDHDFIFKTIKTGYKKWQVEENTVIDDPQTKHVRATRFTKVGKEIDLNSEFIAAGNAIERTRRTAIEQSKDFRFDNDTFIISLNTDDISPDVYIPELDENFSAVTSLLNSDSRYNLMLTPMRNFLRWQRYFNGCLQSYLSSVYKFVSGEGNYDMASNADTDILCNRAVNTNNLSESADISPSVSLGYYFLPILYDISIPMEKEDFDLIDRKEPIGISQTAAGHVDFHIKELEYDIIKGSAIIKAWPETFFNITVPEQTITMMECASAAGAGGFDADYQAVLTYATAQGYTLPSAAQQILQNQYVLDLKAAGAWSRLDVLYVFATDGDSDYARINWINPGTFTCTEEVSALSFTANEGFTPNGTNYLDTHWTPGTDGVNFTLDDAGIFHHTNTDGQSNTAIEYGVYHTTDAAGRILILVRNTLDTIGSVALNSGVAGAGANTNAIGFYLNNRDGSGTTDHDVLKDGVLNDGSNAASGALPDQSVYLFGNHNAAGAFASASTLEMSVWGAGGSMLDIQAEVHTAWDDYFTAL